MGRDMEAMGPVDDVVTGLMIYPGVLFVSSDFFLFLFIDITRDC